jgi:alkylation response protein AidB-like acyl-CoA dehydrogenase
MDLEYTQAEQAFRAECRSWLDANIPRKSLGSHNTADGYKAHTAWEKTLFEAGWAVVSWPRQYGGREASLNEWLIFEEEYYRAGAPPRVTQNGIFLLAPTLFEFGTQEQKDRILRPMAAAEVHWAQAWSEPEAGSDLANVHSSARRVDGGWRVTGQKTWSTRAAFCDGIYGLFRTDPDSARHRGLSYLMVDLHQPGVTVRAVDDLMGDAAFAEIFLDDAFVPDANVIGQLNQGWKIAMATTSSERGLSLRSPGRFLAATDRLAALYRDKPRSHLRQQVVDVWMRSRAYRDYVYGTSTRMMAGGHIGADSSLNKLFWSEMDIALNQAALDLLGSQAEHGESRWTQDYLFSLAGPIYAGTNEIQRNIVASRVLGLPRK